MYSLLSGFYRYMTQKDEYYILILGLDNAGKTTYLEQTQTLFNKNYKPTNLNRITTTVGLNIGKIDISSIRFNFWDLGGQEELQSLWDKYYAECHGVVFMIDSAESGRFDESCEAFNKMIKNEHLNGVPLLLIANKQDLDSSKPVPDIKAVFNTSTENIGSRDCSVMAASALKGDGIDEGIEWLVKCVKRNTHRRPPAESNV